MTDERPAKVCWSSDGSKESRTTSPPSLRLVAAADPAAAGRTINSNSPRWNCRRKLPPAYSDDAGRYQRSDCAAD